MIFKITYQPTKTEAPRRENTEETPSLRKTKHRI